MPPYRCVDSENGLDGNDGLSWSSPLAKIEDALTALPDGGTVFVAPGFYTPASTLNIRGHAIRATGVPIQGGNNPPDAFASPYQTLGATTVCKRFNGALFDFKTSGVVDGIYAYQDTSAYTGAAFAATNGTITGTDDSVNPRIGYIYILNSYAQGSSASFAFDRCVDIDGSANAYTGGPGIRTVHIHNSHFFGARTVGECIRLNRCIHFFMSNCEAVVGGTADASIKVLDAQSTTLNFNNVSVASNFSTAAADSLGSAPGVLSFTGGNIMGNLTFASGAKYNRFATQVLGTVTDSSGNVTNAYKQLAS